jgi:hypothetical protein
MDHKVDHTQLYKLLALIYIEISHGEVSNEVLAFSLRFKLSTQLTPQVHMQNYLNMSYMHMLLFLLLNCSVFTFL